MRSGGIVIQAKVEEEAVMSLRTPRGQVSAAHA